MSRIGKNPIELLDKVTVQVKDTQVEVKGPKGTLTHTFPKEISVKVADKKVVVEVKDTTHPKSRAFHGLTRTLIANMIKGVVDPWKKSLEIQGVGYRASKQGQVINLSLGYSHPINFKCPDTVQFTVDGKQTLIALSCPDKELLGTTAAKIRSLRPPEPYRGKGIRYLGEKILRKAGKAVGSTGAAGGGGKK